MGWINTKNSKPVIGNLQLRAFLMHLVFWITLMLGFIAMSWPRFHSLWEAVLYQCYFLPVWLAATYINWGILMPHFFYRKNKLLYILLLLIIIPALTILQRYFMLYWVFPNIFPGELPAERMPFLIYKLVEYAVIILFPVIFSIGIRISWDWYEEKNRAQQLVVERKESELNYLKAQINPHFLFNILNNLYGLSLEGSEKVPKLILKLSKILNYSLYESESDHIAIGNEIELIKDFIALERERYEERIKVDFTIDENLDWDLQIPPLLLIPLVENAFKHGVNESIEGVPISIEIKKPNDYLYFEVINSIAIPEDRNNHNGLGLKNLKRRLELLYPKAYTFDTCLENEEFKATLKLNLNG